MNGVLPETSAPRAGAAELGARVVVRGAVQGIGFRPFVYQIARELGLSGGVHNSPDGVVIDIQGPRASLEEFLLRLEAEKPPYALIRETVVSYRDPGGTARGFEIGPSQADGRPCALMVPDLATCPECRREIFDPANRRYRYPFTNCTHCGPRFSIIRALPYDRANTTMGAFTMCPECRREYSDPRDRRFHAQPNACPACGPQLALWDGLGRVLSKRNGALAGAAEGLRRGRIVALKGIGGFQFLVDARDEAAVRRLRRLKERPDKAFAVMLPAVADVEAHSVLAPDERALLVSAAAPIVLLLRRPESGLAPSVAPGNPRVGVMLPYSPLHHLLLAELGFPVVATSGNLSDETICTDEGDALRRLNGIADLFLVHDRPIERPVDDSVVRSVLGREMVLRRARGHAPMPVRLAAPVAPVFAGGAYLKNCVALATGRDVFLSQHIGDLGTPEAIAAFGKAAEDLPRLYATKPGRGACDAHPDYPSTSLVRAAFKAVTPVQHHYAHVLACMAEHGLAAPVLGICWDGTGHGDDGTAWGGEFLTITDTAFRRMGHLRTFPLPGGDAAAREPRRCALGLAYAVAGDALFSRPGEPVLAPFSPAELPVLRRALARRLNCPRTSSAGRLFDAVASLLGIRQRSTFEGQAAMELEFAVEEAEAASYPFALGDKAAVIVDWQPTLAALRRDLGTGESRGRIAARFHNTLVDVVAAMARKAALEAVVLTGGCFQNAFLLTRAVQRLLAEGFSPYWPQKIPPNDGGIALGQVAAVARLSAGDPQESPARQRPDSEPGNPPPSPKIRCVSQSQAR